MNKINGIMLFKKILFHIIFFLANSYSFSQANKNFSDNYLVLHWDVNAGLAHDQVYCMLKDVNGFLWIGTQDGLSRFDGSTFKNFFYDPKKHGSISGIRIQSLKEDSLHNIWIGTDRGLSRYDIKADTFSNFFHDFKTPTFSSYIIPFWATKNEIYCQETDSLITSYNIHSFEKKILVKLVSTDSVHDSYWAKQYFVFDSISNSIWFLRYYGRGLLQIEIRSGKRAVYHFPSGESMCLDAGRNSIWINTHAGVIEFSLRDKQIHQADTLKQLAKQNITGHIGMAFDRLGRLWFYTFSKGILIYDPKNESVRPVFENDSDMQKKMAEANSCIYCDRVGITWTGSWLRQGVFQLMPFSQVAKNYDTDHYRSQGLISDYIFNIIRGHDNIMWLGTSAGLLTYNSKKDSFNLQKITGLPNLPDKTLAPIFEDTILHTILFKAEYSGKIYKLNLTDGKCEQIIFLDHSGHSFISDGLEGEVPVHYKNGCVIRAAYRKNDILLQVYGNIPEAKEIFSFPEKTINSFSIADHFIFLERSAALGNLSYVDSGNKWALTNTPMDSIAWTTISQDKNDLSFWVVSPRQVVHYSHNFLLLKKYGLEDGLPHDNIYGLAIDNSGNAWFNTNRTIYRLNLKTEQISALAEKDDFQNSDFRDLGEGIAKDAGGDLYFTAAGITKGFKRISPGQLISTKSLAYIRSLNVKEFTLPLSTSANDVEQLSLKYFQNRIDIQTGVIDFFSRGKSQIRYKLETEDRKVDWQYAPENYTVRYEELPPGNYRLHIQSGNIANEFNGAEKVLSITISPAFWNTWWFRIIAGIFIFGVFYLVIRYRTQQRFKLQLERSGKEKQIAELGQKTAELQQQKIEVEMQALRAQMNPHFIFNSLNSINRFILQNNRLQASEYLTKFSKLVRMILQNSQSALIPLESELESLGLYLEMECLRFNYHFDYKISVPKDLDIEVLKVPPLILQPYVENAIWHGLMHKEEKGQLNVEVLQQGDMLYFKIADNGIGRKKASEIAGKSATKHKSMGLKITANRIAMIQHSNEEGSPVKINDLTAADGSAAGTEVIIKVPVIEKE